MQEYYPCLRDPHSQAVLRSGIKRAISRGVDGRIANRFYRHDCLCECCVRDFKSDLAGKFNRGQLKKLFQINDLESHVFTELVSARGILQAASRDAPLVATLKQTDLRRPVS